MLHRALLLHPTEFSFASGAADNIKKWRFPEGRFIRNLSGHNAIVNCLAVNNDNVFVSGGDNGTLAFWDWPSGYKFQQVSVPPQPGSLQSEVRSTHASGRCEGWGVQEVWRVGWGRDGTPFSRT